MRDYQRAYSGRIKMDIGRLCVKIAGRDAGKKCIIVDVIDKNTVLIDGQTRRRKCNPRHLEPLKETTEIKKNASHKEIEEVFKKLGLETRTTKPKKAVERPRKIIKKKEKTEKKEEKIEKKQIKEDKPKTGTLKEEKK